MTTNESEELAFRNSRKENFTQAQKWALLQEYEQCLDWGSKSEFCRRVGIWAGTARHWQRERDAGRLVDPASVEDMSKPKKASRFEEQHELKRLRRENERLQQQLDQSEAAVEVLGKAAALLEALAKSAQTTEQPPTPPIPQGRPAWLQKPPTTPSPSTPQEP